MIIYSTFSGGSLLSSHDASEPLILYINENQIVNKQPFIIINTIANINSSQ